MWQRNNRTWTIEFKPTCRPTPVHLIHLHVCFHEKNLHTLCKRCLFYFVRRKCHDIINIFLENTKVPRMLKISILMEDWNFAIEILSQNQSPHLKSPYQHTNFVIGIQCYSLPLKCAYTSLDSWIRHCSWIFHY